MPCLKRDRSDKQTPASWPSIDHFHPFVSPKDFSPTSRRQFPPNDLCTCTESIKLASCHSARQGRHAAVGARIELVGIDKLERFAQGIGDFLGRFNGVGCHVDGADHHFFATDQFDQIDGNMRVVAFQRDDVDVGLLQLGEGLFVLAPFRPCLLYTSPSPRD